MSHLSVFLPPTLPPFVADETRESHRAWDNVSHEDVYQDNLNVTHYLQVLWSHLTAAPKNSAQPTLDQVLKKYPITSPIFEFNKSMDRKYYYGRNSIILKSVGELIKDMIWLWPTSVGHILDIDLGRGVGENMRISQDVQWAAVSGGRGLLRGEFQKG